MTALAPNYDTPAYLRRNPRLARKVASGTMLHPIDKPSKASKTGKTRKTGQRSNARQAAAEQAAKVEAQRAFNIRLAMAAAGLIVTLQTLISIGAI